MSIDIRAGIIAAVFLTLIFFLISVVSGIQTVLSGKKIKFFQLRQNQILRGWRLIILGIFWVLLGIGVYFFGEPVAYRFITPHYPFRLNYTHHHSHPLHHSHSGGILHPSPQPDTPHAHGRRGLL